MKLHLLLTLVLSSILCFSQTNEIDSLRFQIFKGDIEALKSMGKYLDSKKIVTDHLGYHIRKAEERQIAARNIRESFFSEEMSFLKGDRVSSTIFFNFLSTNQIVFDEDIGYFILKNQNPDTTKYILFKTSSSVIDSINDEFSKSMPSIMSECGADWSYTLHNPQCLLLLSQYFLKQRAKWNIYFFNDETYFKCFRYLTHIDFAVPDEDSSFNFIYHLTSEFKRRNLYNYFYHHYKDYKWNDSLHYFINTTETPRAKNELVELFELLQSEDDSIAFSSFSRICESDPIEVTRLSKEFNEQDHDDNDKLPTFTYRFLPVIAHLTDYYRRNNIHYKSSGEIKKILEKLLNENSFKKRYEIEELLIKTATIDDIYAIEHFGLINENNFNNTYSIGRVLDKWYSKNWKAVYSEKKTPASVSKKS
nr:hypothetical protein [uncultured bacterium]